MNNSALPEVVGHEFMILADANGITRLADALSDYSILAQPPEIRLSLHLIDPDEA